LLLKKIIGEWSFIVAIIRRKVLERLSGLSKVYREGEYLSDVAYSFQVVQIIDLSSTLTREEEVKGLLDITGHITVIEGERDFTKGEQLEIHLEDGRTWKFFVKSGDPVSGKYWTINASREGIV